MLLLPLRLLFGWLLVVGPVRGWAQGVPHPFNPENTGPALADLTARAAAIFEGLAVAYRAFWGTSEMIYTASTVEVDKVFKGAAAAATVEVVTEGGGLPNGQGGGPAEGGVSIGNHATGLFFAVPFRDAAHVPRVPPPAQVYRVVDSGEGFFTYTGLPPQPNAADMPWVRYSPVETALYPLLTRYTSATYRVLRPFDIRTYDFM